MNQLPTFPVGLVLAGRPVVMVGGGEVAERRVGKLIECGARVTVVAPEVTERLRELAVAGAIRWEPRPAIPDDVRHADLVFLATNRDDVNRDLAAEARRAGALVNRADRSGEGDFLVPMTTSVAGLTVAVHGGGASPAFSRWVARRVEQALGPEVEEFGRLITEARRQILAMESLSQPERAERLRRLVEGDLFEVLVRDGRQAARCRAEELLNAPLD